MDDEVLNAFREGVNAYWSGEEPDHWNDPARRERSPYLSGWYMASMWEVSEGWITDEFGDSLQDTDIEWDDFENEDDE